jgi:DNA topoisomerase-1
MPYTIVIVESPAKCGKIEKFLGPGYKCVASFGHIQQLNGLGSINIDDNFKPTFTECDSKKQQISKMRKLIVGADDVMLAADDDREGEAIAWHVCQVFNLPVATTKRIIFHEVTESALKRAVSEAITVNMDVVHAQQARQVLDLLVGYKISPVLWQKISQKTKSGLSAGRCQTPALRLIYDNKRDIDASPGRKVYNTTGYFTSKNLPFTLNHNHDNEDKMGEFLESSVNHDHVYKCGPIRSTTKQPPSPYTTSGLQQAASNELRISPKDTMKACQKLYEGGYITYMRTDSMTYSIEFIKKASDHIKKSYGEEYPHAEIERLAERGEKKTKKSKKTKKKKEDEPAAQEAHEAIRPTDVLCEEVSADMTPKEAKMYKLIRRNTLESCMAPATYSAVTGIISAPDDYEYRYSSEQVVFPGWKAVAGYEKVSEDFAYLQTLRKNAIIEYKKMTSKVSMKDLKTHYTEAKLVQLLEQNGIGRPSTFSSLVDKIQERNYVKKDNVKGKTLKCVDFELVEEELSEIENQREFGNERNKLVITPLGVLVVEFLIKHFDKLFQYEYTKGMEDTLDAIAKGNKVWHELCNECLQEIDTLSEGLLEDREVIRIDEHNTYMIGRYGPVIKHTKNDKTTFKNVREDIDIDKLRDGGYELSELVVAKKTSQGIALGEHNGKAVFIKNGRYGKYVEWGDVKKTIKTDKDEADITLEDAVALLSQSPSLIRTINETTTARTGKFGDYIMHKKPGWKKPRFLKLDGFIKEHGVNSYKTCDLSILIKWLEDTYKI